MFGTFLGRGHVAAATAALVAVGVLAAVPPGQSAGRSVGAGHWGPVEKIAEYSGGSFDPIYNDRARPARVEVRPNGSAVTAWIALRPRPLRLLVSRHGASGGWRGAHDLSSGVPGRVGPFDLAVGGPGSASVAWSTKVGHKTFVMESHLDGGIWTAPVQVGPGTKPLTAIDGSGVTTLAWNGNGVWTAQRTAHGRHWTRPTRIGPPGVWQLRLATNPTGDLAAAWSPDALGGQLLGEGARVMAAVRPHGSASWTSPVTLDAMTVVDSVRLAIDGSGRALAMWSGLGDQTRDYAGFVAWARSTPRGQWSRRRDVTQRHIGEWGGLVDVSMNGDGLAVAAWLEITGGGERSRLWAARYRGDGTWSAPRRVARGDWWDVSPWMDDAGVAHLVADRGAIWAFSQGPGAAWTGTALNSGYLLDANGAGSRMAMVFYRKHALQSRILDVR